MDKNLDKLYRNLIIFMILLFLLGLMSCDPKVEIVEKEIIKEITVRDTIYVENVVKEFVPKYITKEIIKEVPIEVIKEVIVEKPVEVIKTVYVDKPFETIVNVPLPKENEWYIGMGVGFDKTNFISILRTSALYKTKNDKAFSIDLGVSNKIFNQETGESSLTPYIGGTMYWKIGSDK
tara:strand:+ start:6727 stop:7260 length:534 start_codon:yes stop_codon:yes gene_type:complete